MNLFTVNERRDATYLDFQDRVSPEVFMEELEHVLSGYNLGAPIIVSDVQDPSAKSSCSMTVGQPLDHVRRYYAHLVYQSGRYSLLTPADLALAISE